MHYYTSFWPLRRSQGNFSKYNLKNTFSIQQVPVHLPHIQDQIILLLLDLIIRYSRQDPFPSNSSPPSLSRPKTMKNTRPARPACLRASQTSSGPYAYTPRYTRMRGAHAAPGSRVTPAPDRRGKWASARRRNRRLLPRACGCHCTPQQPRLREIYTRIRRYVGGAQRNGDFPSRFTKQIDAGAACFSRASRVPCAAFSFLVLSRSMYTTVCR